MCSTVTYPQKKKKKCPAPRIGTGTKCMVHPREMLIPRKHNMLYCLKSNVSLDFSGLELIIPVFGYFCRACTKFYNNEKISRKEHSADPDHLENVKVVYVKLDSY